MAATKKNFLQTLCYLSQSELFACGLKFGVDLNLLPSLLLYVVDGGCFLLKIFNGTYCLNTVMNIVNFPYALLSDMRSLRENTNFMTSPSHGNACKQIILRNCPNNILYSEQSFVFGD
jgi:hypothetical protein